MIVGAFRAGDGPRLFALHSPAHVLRPGRLRVQASSSAHPDQQVWRPAQKVWGCSFVARLHSRKAPGPLQAREQPMPLVVTNPRLTSGMLLSGLHGRCQRPVARCRRKPSVGVTDLATVPSAQRGHCPPNRYPSGEPPEADRFGTIRELAHARHAIWSPSAPSEREHAVGPRRGRSGRR